jgi:pyrroloquinoline quinone biosynthesis protein B
MQIRLLGTAAGGGVPQWNCNCPICRECRAGTGRVLSRTQSSVAVSADGRRWFLLNASPDLRGQIESTPPLRPASAKTRGSPIEGVLLTNADLDHTLGLFLLREGERLPVHATIRVQQSLAKGLSLPSTMKSFAGIEWLRPPKKLSPLPNRDGSRCGILYQAIPLDGKAPRFVKPPPPSRTGNAVGYRLVDERTGGRLLFLPDVAAVDEKLSSVLMDCDALLFDGTFWSEHEMHERGAGNSTAASMGHVPISGSAGSLKVLAALRARHRIYVHINNTNPVLLEDSPERGAVVAAGCVVGRDGMEIRI